MRRWLWGPGWRGGGCMVVVYEERNGTGSGRILIQVLSGNPNEDNNIHPLSASWNLQQKYLYKYPMSSHDPSLTWQNPPGKLKTPIHTPTPTIASQHDQSTTALPTPLPYSLSLSLSLPIHTHLSAATSFSKKKPPPPSPSLEFPCNHRPYFCALVRFVPA